MKAVYVEENQSVKAGDVLVELDPRDYQVARGTGAGATAEGRRPMSARKIRICRSYASTSRTSVSTSKSEVANAEAALAGAERDQAGGASLACWKWKPITARRKPMWRVTRRWWTRTKFRARSMTRWCATPKPWRRPWIPRAPPPKPRKKWWSSGGRNSISRAA